MNTESDATQSTFASDLGWRAGEWPQWLNWMGESYILLSRSINGEGELESVTYRCDRLRRNLRVYND